MVDVVPEAFPWSKFLTRGEVDEFAAELASAESIGNPASAADVIDAWRHTAEVLADPELAAVLSAPSDEDFGAVPEPGGRR